MKVKKLRSILEKMDPNYDVVLHYAMSGPEAIFVSEIPGDGDSGVVVLETEDDNDMAQVIETMLEEFADDGVDEADGYAELLEHGINPEMVEAYLGKEPADHMRNVCKEHGLL